MRVVQVAQLLSELGRSSIVELEPVPDEPVLMADDALVVADLHIGLEEELQEKGIRIPSRAEGMGRKLAEIADRRGASRLIILGDVKHLVPKMASRERRDVYVCFRDLVPAFNELCGGMPVNDIRARFLGPLFDEDIVRVDDAAIHLLDGTNLGRLRDIQVDLGFRPEDYRQ